MFSRYEYVQLFTLLSFTLILFINIIRQIIEDIKNNLVSNISIILFIYNFFIYYLVFLLLLVHYQTCVFNKKIEKFIN